MFLLSKFFKYLRAFGKFLALNEVFQVGQNFEFIAWFFVTNANLVTYKVLFDHVIVIITSLRTIFLHFSVRTWGVKSQL